MTGFLSDEMSINAQVTPRNGNHDRLSRPRRAVPDGHSWHLNRKGQITASHLFFPSQDDQNEEDKDQEITNYLLRIESLLRNPIPDIIEATNNTEEIWFSAVRIGLQIPNVHSKTPRVTMSNTSEWESLLSEKRLQQGGIQIAPVTAPSSPMQGNRNQARAGKESTHDICKQDGTATLGNYPNKQLMRLGDIQNEPYVVTIRRLIVRHALAYSQKRIPAA
ncbi:hypothetical protein FIE12Z_7048 [Fusarium flagelliforme]|uniref:Uncharacterized protein n=1 Tax=Fusarium flagelliforme TaxID=2675880 RepID=A0A395MNT4_9HYPO|nr:hypothetical protein FIE12Z_7048 [Fusarium flagelliforme]